MDMLIHIPGTACVNTINKLLHKDKKILIFKMFSFLKFMIILKPQRRFWTYIEIWLSWKPEIAARKWSLTKNCVFRGIYCLVFHSSSCSCVYFLWELLGLRALFKTAYFGWAPGWALASPTEASHFSQPLHRCSSCRSILRSCVNTIALVALM